MESPTSCTLPRSSQVFSAAHTGVWIQVYFSWSAKRVNMEAFLKFTKVGFYLCCYFRTTLTDAVLFVWCDKLKTAICTIRLPPNRYKSENYGDAEVKILSPGTSCMYIFTCRKKTFKFQSKMRCTDWLAKLQNTPQLISASLTCVGRLWRSRHNTIDAILI